MSTVQRPVAVGVKNFLVIASDLIRESDKANLKIQLGKFTSAFDCLQSAPAQGFVIQTIDNHGRVKVVKWRGIEVALLFQRSLTNFVELPFEVTAAVKPQSNAEAWVMVNLLDVSIPDVTQALQESYSLATKELEDRKGFMKTLQSENELKSDAINRLEATVDRLKEEIKIRDKAIREKGYTPPPKVKVEKPRDWLQELKDKQAAEAAAILKAKQDKIDARKAKGAEKRAKKRAERLAAKIAAKAKKKVVVGTKTGRTQTSKPNSANKAKASTPDRKAKKKKK